MPNFKSPTGQLIVAVLETVTCTCGVSDIASNGRTFEYDGTGSQVHWDDQAPVKRNGSLVFLDEDGSEWTFDQLTEIVEEEEA